MTCTECGKPRATMLRHDAANARHWFHRACWRRFCAWLVAGMLLAACQDDCPTVGVTRCENAQAQICYSDGWGLVQDCVLTSQLTGSAFTCQAVDAGHTCLPAVDGGSND